MDLDWEKHYVEESAPWDSGVPSEHLKNFLSEKKLSACRALELGCGTGTNAVYLAQNGFDVTAIDLSPTALQRAREKAKQAGTTVNFIEGDVTELMDLGEPFPFVFDRGTYHVVRKKNLSAFQKMLATRVEPGGFYLVLAGNANTLAPPDQGPPVVRADELVYEIELAGFDLVELKEAVFHGIKVEGRNVNPLAWNALFRRRTKERSD